MRKNLRRPKAVKQSVNPTLGDAPSTGAHAAGLGRRERGRMQAEIAQACAVHDQYLAAFGSLGEAVRADGE